MATENQEQVYTDHGLLRFTLSETLAAGTAFTALLRCLNLCSLNFWIENYAAAAVEMQMCGDKIHGLKEAVDRMQISTGQSSP